MKNIKENLNEIPNNLFFQLILVLIFSLPLISTLAQFITSGFIKQYTPVPILFWPGVNQKFSLSLPAWLIFGIMAISYVTGIMYMLKKNTLGKVVVAGILWIILAKLTVYIISTAFGLKELESINSVIKAGVANRLIFSLWHNPAWEEIVFRGLPLILLLALKKKLSTQKYKLAIVLYIIIPSIAFALYHVPNHGYIRIVDTFIGGIIFAFLALKYTFFAPLILHYFADAAAVISMGKMKALPQNEVLWLVNNYTFINTVFSIGVIVLLISIPIIFIKNIIKSHKINNEKI